MYVIITCKIIEYPAEAKCKKFILYSGQAVCWEGNVFSPFCVLSSSYHHILYFVFILVPWYKPGSGSHAGFDVDFSTAGQIN